MKKFFIFLISLTVVILTVFSATFSASATTVCNDRHNYGNYKTVTSATYYKEGKKQRKCVRCGHTESTTIPKLKRINLGKCKITITKNYVFTGKPIKANIKITYGKTALKNGTDYTVTYKNNKNYGTATATVQGKGKYSGTVTKKFTVSPNKTSFTSAYSPKFKRVFLRYKKSSSADGYRIKYSKYKDFRDADYKYTPYTETTVLGLDAKTTYYFCVSAYKKVNGKLVHSDFSPQKAVTVKSTAVKQSQKNMICLTFDDGPSANNTPKILDTLKANNIKATFFIVNYSSANKKTVQRIIDEGHTLGVHCYSHDYAKIYSSYTSFMNYFNKLKDKIYKDFGYKIKVMRFPGGSSNAVSANYCHGIMTKLTKKFNSSSVRYFDWNVDSGDADGACVSKAYIYNNTVSGLLKNRTNVVLMHDSSSKATTAETLQNIIDYAHNNGYVFSTITPKTQQIKHRVNN